MRKNGSNPNKELKAIKRGLRYRLQPDNIKHFLNISSLEKNEKIPMFKVSRQKTVEGTKTQFKIGETKERIY